MNPPKLRWIKQARQFAVDISIDGKQRRFYLGRDRDAAKDEYKGLIAAHVLRQLNGSEGTGMIPQAPVAADTGLPLAKLAEEFLQYVEANNRTATHQYYQTLIQRFLGEHRGLLASQVTPMVLERFKRKMQRERLKPRTINAHLAAVITMFNWAVKLDLIPEHKLNRVKKIASGASRTRVLSDVEKRKLLEYADDEMREIIKLLLLTGIRPCEVGNLSWEDVDWENRQILLYEHKTATTTRESKPRIIPLTTGIAAILEPRKEEKWIVFPRPDGGRHNKDSLGKRFAKIVRAAGLRGVTLYTLRHTFGTDLSTNVDLKTVAELMGHTTTRTTERYVHPVAPHVRDAMKYAEKGVLDGGGAAQDDSKKASRS